MIETKKISLRRDTAERIAKLGTLKDTYETVIRRILDFYMVHHPQLPSTPITQLPGTPITQLSSTPITQLPGTPVTQLPGTPVTQLPSTPITRLPASKICPDCRKEKALAEYYLDHGSRPKTVCKTCYEVKEKKRKEKARTSKKKARKR